MTEYKLVSISIDPKVSNFLLPYDENADKKSIKWYQSGIQSLMQAAMHSWPDIAYAMGVLSQYYDNPGTIHYSLVIQIFRYLSGTLDPGITFITNSEDKPVGYTSSDNAKLIDISKCTDGDIFMLSSRSLSRLLKLYNTVAILSYRAEYMAKMEAEKDALQVVQFLSCFGFCLPSQLVSLRADNKKAISPTKNHKFHQKTKHIKIRCSLILKKVEQNKIPIFYISTKEMLVDRLTEQSVQKCLSNFGKISE